MCTVTFLPKSNGDFIFTSNRDEQPDRKTLAPDFYKVKDIQYLYPKDEKAGGTWVALSENERLVCLLNGAYENHEDTSPYAYSRGLVVKEVLEAENAKWAIEDLELEGVEPFTLIALDWSFMPICIELIWDGVKKDIRILSNKSKIWSSSTLYDKPIKAERESWFANFEALYPEATEQNVLDFHLNDSFGTKEIAIKMKRSYVETTSVTSIVKKGDTIKMYYLDVLTGEHASTDLFSYQSKTSV
tara:strand:- start:23148 stop:23879 length:732 start_codon:yes stop_codon:yes gene_type:complete